MEILRNIEQIKSQLNEIFIFDESFNFEDFISKKIDLNEIVKVKKKEGVDLLNNIENFSNYLFQLRNYIFALSNFVRMLLHCEMQIELFNFIKRLFIGQIGPV